MTRYYKFSVETGELVGFVDTPKSYPANHLSLTAIAPPEAQEDHARVFNRETQEWSQVESHIGETVYSKEDGQEIEVNDLGPLPDDVTTEEPGPYDKWQDGKGWTEDAEKKRAATVPRQITRRQLLIGLMQAEFITAQEAVAAAQTGTVPAAIQDLFDRLEPAEAAAATITWASMSVAERDHPLVEAIATARGLTEQQVDDLFRSAAEVSAS